MSPHFGALRGEQCSQGRSEINAGNKITTPTGTLIHSSVITEFWVVQGKVSVGGEWQWALLPNLLPNHLRKTHLLFADLQKDPRFFALD
jgi:hypothetical protein